MVPCNGGFGACFSDEVVFSLFALYRVEPGDRSCPDGSADPRIGAGGRDHR